MQPWTQNCGVRRLPLDFRDQYFGCEIELTGINRATAAHALADLFGTRAEHSGGGYDAYRVKDLDGKEWKIVRDGSIHPECRRRSVLIGETYKVELNSPKLEYGEMEKLHEALEKCREETQMGVGIATAFAHQKILPAMYGKMLLGGAQSGELVQVTENLARRTAQEAENGLCSVIDRTEPILIGFLTASVGLTLLSVMLPLLGILSAI